jgi:hypothetical protein
VAASPERALAIAPGVIQRRGVQVGVIHRVLVWQVLELPWAQKLKTARLEEIR